MAIGALLEGLERVHGNNFGLEKKCEEGFQL